MLTLHHIGVSERSKALTTKHAAHHVSKAGILEHALHALLAHHAAHQAAHHPRHAPRVARHLLDDLKARVFPSLGFQKPGEEQKVRWCL